MEAELYQENIKRICYKKTVYVRDNNNNKKKRQFAYLFKSKHSSI